MQKGVFAVCALALSLVVASTASAQTCMGFSPISKDHPAQVGAGYAHTNGTNTVYGDGTFGNEQFFGNASIGHVSVTGAGWGLFNVTGGGQLNVKSMDKEWGVCPDATFQLQFGNALTASVLSYFGGVAVGGNVYSKNKMGIVPTAMIQFGQARVKGIPNSADSYGVLTFGVGFVFQENMTLRPALTQTFAQAGGQSTGFMLDFRYAFGKK